MGMLKVLVNNTHDRQGIGGEGRGGGGVGGGGGGGGGGLPTLSQTFIIFSNFSIQFARNKRLKLSPAIVSRF